MSGNFFYNTQMLQLLATAGAIVQLCYAHTSGNRPSAMTPRLRLCQKRQQNSNWEVSQHIRYIITSRYIVLEIPLKRFKLLQIHPTPTVVVAAKSLPPSAPHVLGFSNGRVSSIWHLSLARCASYITRWIAGSTDRIQST